MGTMHPRALLVASVFWVGCASAAGNADGGRDVARRLDGGNNGISVSPPFAFEGQRRYVGITGPGLYDDDLSHATVTADPDTGIVIEQVQCSRLRCAFVARIEDRTPNRGAPIPDVTSAVRRFISIVGAQYNYTASIGVFPLDAADGATLGTSSGTTIAVYSTMSLPAGATLRALGRAEAMRIAVLSGAEVHGTFDLSAEGAEAGAGGYAGGTLGGGDGQGPLAGRGSPVAGGGAGHATPGEPGRDAMGTPRGVGGMATSERTVSRLTGGSGGGGGPRGAGGGGGGAMLFAVYGPASFDQARFVARGGDGQGAGGGGAGGTVILAGAPIGEFTVDLTGGQGSRDDVTGARGGSGSAGRLRIDGNVAMPRLVAGTVHRGVWFDLSAIPAIVRTPELTVRGFAPPGTRIAVQNEYGGSVLGRQETTATADGRWSVTFPLEPGPASFIAYDVSGSTPVPSFSGTRVVIRSQGGTSELYAGAVDVVYLPEFE